MNEVNTVKRLRYHAGLEQNVELEVPSMAELLWRKETLRECTEDVIEALETLNLDMNGSIPSQSTTRKAQFPRDLVYAISEIIRLTHQSVNGATSDTEREDATRAAWKLEVAWAAILAGDIDNLRKHIAEEEAARNA